MVSSSDDYDDYDVDANGDDRDDDVDANGDDSDDDDDDDDDDASDSHRLHIIIIHPFFVADDRLWVAHRGGI